jgi:hypothetical protein
MPQWDHPYSRPISIYACERPYDQAPALTKCKLHEPLKSDNHIRLLKLFPPGWPDRLAEKLTHEEDTNIQCDIYQVSLASITTEGRPYFATLSYAWGDPKPAQQIRCSDTLVHVPQSLHDALVYIRHLRMPRLLWVDYLCIDQSNREEKNRQVQRMHLVYSQGHCISWLGVESSHHHDLTTMLPILRWLTKTLEFIDTWDLRHTWYEMEAYFEPSPPSGWSSLRDLPWAALHRCLNRDIFSRLWCVQEALLAQSNDLRTSISHLDIYVLVSACYLLAVVLLRERRPQTVDDDDLDLNLARLRALCSDIDRTLAGRSTYDAILPSIKIKRPAANTHSAGVHLGQVASAAVTTMSLHHKECSDPRDRIYAVMALCNLDTSYQISYSKPVHEVFVDFTLQCLRDTNLLELFHARNRIAACRDRSVYRFHSRHRKWIHGLPTWCPDFAGPGCNTRNLLTHNIYRSSPLKACEGRPARFTVLSRQIVGALGVCVGTVMSVCKPDWEKKHNIRDDWIIGHANASMSSCASRVEAVCPGVSLWRLYLNVCLTGVDLSRCSAWSRISESLPARTRNRMVKSTIGAAWIMRYAREFAPKDGLPLPRKFDADTWKRVARDVDIFLESTNFGTRLFTTNSPAAVLGTGLDGTRVGDIVCVLYGSDTPLVLRQVGNKGHCKLIGDCYVEGIMHGEALKMKLEEREFRLI